MSHLLEDQIPGGEVAAEATPEQLLEMEAGHRFELIDGKLVERHMGAHSSEVGARIIRFLGNHAEGQKLGKVFTTDCGYQIFAPDTPHVRYPDGSFVARGRLPNDRAPEGHMRIAPDLAIEVVSPNDTAEEIEARRLAFLRAGTRLFWVVYPQARTVHTSRPDGAARVLTEADELSGEDVLPGFVCKVAALFEDT